MNLDGDTMFWDLKRRGKKRGGGKYGSRFHILMNIIIIEQSMYNIKVPYPSILIQISSVKPRNMLIRFFFYIHIINNS